MPRFYRKPFRRSATRDKNRRLLETRHARRPVFEALEDRTLLTGLPGETIGNDISAWTQSLSMVAQNAAALPFIGPYLQANGNPMTKVASEVALAENALSSLPLPTQNNTFNFVLDVEDTETIPLNLGVGSYINLSKNIQVTFDFKFAFTVDVSPRELNASVTPTSLKSVVGSAYWFDLNTASGASFPTALSTTDIHHTANADQDLPDTSMALVVTPTLPPGIGISGGLGGLLTLSGYVESDSKSLDLILGFDPTSANLAIAGDVDVDLMLNLSLANNPSSPLFTTGLEVTWQASSSQSLNDTDTNTGNPLWSDFTIAFQGVKLDIDTLLGGSSGMIGSVFSSLSQVLDFPSLKQVIDLLNNKVPILNESIADLIGNSLGEVVSAIAYIQSFTGFSSNNGADTYINLGSFNIATSANFDDLATAPLAGLVSNVTEVTNTLGSVLADAGGDTAAESALTSLEAVDTQDTAEGAGNNPPISFPIITDPEMAFGFLLGQNVDLVDFNLDANWSWDPPIENFPVLGPISLGFGGDFGVGFEIDGGYDTRGIQMGDLADGLYLNTVTSNVDFNAELFLTCSALVVEVSGGLGGELKLTLGPSTTHLYVDQLGTADVETSGEIYIEANVSVGLYIGPFDVTIATLNLARVTLLSFGSSPGPSSNPGPANTILIHPHGGGEVITAGPYEMPYSNEDEGGNVTGGYNFGIAVYYPTFTDFYPEGTESDGVVTTAGFPQYTLIATGTDTFKGSETIVVDDGNPADQADIGDHSSLEPTPNVLLEPYGDAAGTHDYEVTDEVIGDSQSLIIGGPGNNRVSGASIEFGGKMDPGFLQSHGDVNNAISTYLSQLPGTVVPADGTTPYHESLVSLFQAPDFDVLGSSPPEPEDTLEDTNALAIVVGGPGVNNFYSGGMVYGGSYDLIDSSPSPAYTTLNNFTVTSAADTDYYELTGGQGADNAIIVNDMFPDGDGAAPDFAFHQGPPIEAFSRNSVLVVEDHTTSNEFLHASDIQTLTVRTNNLYLDGSLNGSGLMYVFDDMFYRTVNPEYDPPQTVVIDGGTNDNAYTINTVPVKGGPTDSDDTYLASGTETGYGGVEISNTFPALVGTQMVTESGPTIVLSEVEPDDSITVDGGSGHNTYAVNLDNRTPVNLQIANTNAAAGSASLNVNLSTYNHFKNANVPVGNVSVDLKAGELDVSARADVYSNFEDHVQTSATTIAFDNGTTGRLNVTGSSVSPASYYYFGSVSCATTLDVGTEAGIASTILTEPASVGNFTIGGDQPLGSKSATISLDIEGNEGNLVFDPKGGNAIVDVATAGKNLGAIFGSMSLDNALGSLSLSLDDSDGYFGHSLDVTAGGIHWMSGTASAGDGSPVSLQVSTRDYTNVPSTYLGHPILVTAVTPIGVVINAEDYSQTIVDGTPGSLNVNGGNVTIHGASGPVWVNGTNTSLPSFVSFDESTYYPNLSGAVIVTGAGEILADVDPEQAPSSAITMTGIVSPLPYLGFAGFSGLYEIKGMINSGLYYAPGISVYLAASQQVPSPLPTITILDTGTPTALFTPDYDVIVDKTTQVLDVDAASQTTVNTWGLLNGLIVVDSGYLNVVADSGQVIGAITITPSSVIGFTPIPISYSYLSGLGVTGPGSPTVVTITGTSAPLTYNPGSDQSDTINVEEASNPIDILETASVFNRQTVNVGSDAAAGLGTLAGISAPITLSGSLGNNTLNVVDSGDSSYQTGSISGTGFNSSGFSGNGAVVWVAVPYYGVTSVNLVLGQGGGDFRVANTLADAGYPVSVTATGGTNQLEVDGTSGPLNVNVTGGTEAITLGAATHTLDPLKGRVTVSKSLQTSIALDDQRVATLPSYNVTAQSVSRSGFGGLSFSNAQVVFLTSAPLVGLPYLDLSLGAGSPSGAAISNVSLNPLPAPLPSGIIAVFPEYLSLQIPSIPEGAAAQVVFQYPEGNLTASSSYGFDSYASGWFSINGALVPDAADSRVTLNVWDGGGADRDGGANGNISTSGVVVTTSLAIATPSLPAWTVNVPGYQQSVTATGGVGPYTFAVASGSLPPGLSLNPTTGAISGEPTSTASSPFSFTIGVHSGDGEFVTKAYSLVINPAVKFATSSLPAATVNQSGYSQTLGVTGGTGSITFALTSGALPTGMSLNATTGTISGTPTAPGTSTFQITAIDSVGSHDVRSFSITVNTASAYYISIEPNLQNIGSLALDGTAISSTDITRALLSVGSHTLSYTGGQLMFQVSTLGLISYDPTLEGVFEGTGTTVLRINPIGITVDATALTSPSVVLQGRSYSNTALITLFVLPGSETIQDVNDNTVTYSVSNVGAVGYDPSLQGILSGSGTSELVVKGAAVTVDATALSTPSVQVDGREYNNTAPLGLVLLPGAESLNDLSTGDGVSFTVSNTGTIAFDASLQGILSGSGTSELIVKGTAITIDATALSTPSVQADGREFNNTAPLDLVVLPGAESLNDLSTGDGVSFTVSTAGTIGFDASLQGILSGSGTSQLVVKGTAITVDATARLDPECAGRRARVQQHRATRPGCLARCRVPPRSVHRRRRLVYRLDCGNDWL